MARGLGVVWPPGCEVICGISARAYVVGYPSTGSSYSTHKTLAIVGSCLGGCGESLPGYSAPIQIETAANARAGAPTGSPGAKGKRTHLGIGAGGLAGTVRACGIALVPRWAGQPREASSRVQGEACPAGASGRGWPGTPGQPR